MRTRLLTVLAAVVVCLGFAPTAAQAVTNGQFDGNAHPYVAYEDNRVFACSGALLSPTVMLTGRSLLQRQHVRRSVPTP